MFWSEQVFRYCERGADPGFWAEPLNALSNLAFVIGAAWAARCLARERRGEPAREEAALVVLVAVIGVGSFLFHTFATRWAALADVAPIGIFMLAYLAYALRAFLRLGWMATAAGLAVFVAALHLAGSVLCSRGGLIGVAQAARGPCLNGTLGYLPAWLAMAGIGGILAWRLHPAGRLLLAASGVFLASMLLRTVDLEVCTLTQLAGRPLGTHVWWHLLNATTLTMLLAAAIRHGRKTGTSRPVDSPGQPATHPL
jgi:hypothetical protein